MKIIDYYRRFRQWQITPTPTEPVDSYSEYVCVNCGESFDGRYCPRCGQKGDTRRLTLHNVLSNALDVWGAGNRSMPRNIIHLLFRPGYMIADYLRGHRQPFFPPFKMLFIFVTTFLMVVNVVRWAKDVKDLGHESLTEVLSNSTAEGNIDYTKLSPDEQSIQEFEERRKTIGAMLSSLDKWLNDHRAISIVLLQVFVAVSIWICFRRSKRLPRLSLSEQLFVQVFISSQMLLISMIYFFLSLFWLPAGEDDLPNIISTAVYVIDYKQLFGFSWWGTLWRATVSMILIVSSVVILVVVVWLVIMFPLIKH